MKYLIPLIILSTSYICSASLPIINYGGFSSSFLQEHDYELFEKDNLQIMVPVDVNEIQSVLDALAPDTYVALNVMTLLPDNPTMVISIHINRIEKLFSSSTEDQNAFHSGITFVVIANNISSSCNIEQLECPIEMVVIAHYIPKQRVEIVNNFWHYRYAQPAGIASQITQINDRKYFSFHAKGKDKFEFRVSTKIPDETKNFHVFDPALSEALPILSTIITDGPGINYPSYYVGSKSIDQFMDPKHIKLSKKIKLPTGTIHLQKPIGATYRINVHAIGKRLTP